MSGQGGPRRGRWAAVLATLSVLLAACGGGDDDEALPPPPPIAEPTTLPADPYAVPAVIDPAYVNRVLEGIDAAVGEVVRIVYRTRDLPPEVIDRLKAIYLHREDINLLLGNLQDDLRKGFAGFRAEPGNKKTHVEEILSASRECVFVRVRRDYSLVATNPNPNPGPEWVGLKPADPAADPNRYNPTPWMVAIEGLTSEGSQPPTPCAA